MAQEVAQEPGRVPTRAWDRSYRERANFWLGGKVGSGQARAKHTNQKRPTPHVPAPTLHGPSSCVGRKKSQ